MKKDNQDLKISTTVINEASLSVVVLEKSISSLHGYTISIQIESGRKQE